VAEYGVPGSRLGPSVCHVHVDVHRREVGSMEKDGQARQQTTMATHRLSLGPRGEQVAKVAVVALLAIAAIVAPFTLSGFWVRLLTGMFMYAALASSLNITLGYTGYADFGNVVYFGIGAYTTGILTKVAHLPLPLSMLAGGVAGALFATILGPPILRLRGNYFAIATMGISQAALEIVRNLRITGGSAGFSLFLVRMEPRMFNMLTYFIMFALMVSHIIISYLVLHSRFGYGLRAIKADENGAAVMGIDTTRYKTMAWALSAFCTGLVGGAYAFWFFYFTPADVFNTLISVKYFVMIYLGGIGTVWGPVIGAFLLELVSDFVWGRFLGIHLGVLGAVIVLIVLFMPKGFIHMVRTRVLPLVSRFATRQEGS